MIDIKKLISAFLALTMLATVMVSTSCSEKFSEWNGERYEPALSVSYCYPFLGGDASSLTAAGWEDDRTAWTDYARDNLGIKLELAFDVHSLGDYDTRFTNVIVTGDVPDLMNLSYDEYAYKYIKLLHENELLADITDVISEYSCDALAETIEVAGDEVFYPATFDGRIYAMPQIINSNSKNSLFWVREDWLSNLGLKAPDDYSSFIDMLKAFTNKDPDGNGADDTCGLALNLIGMGDNASVFFNMFGAYPGQWVEDNNGKLVFGTLSSEMKAAVTELRELYASGCLWNELDWNSETAVKNSYAGVIEGTSSSVVNYRIVLKKNSTANFIPIPAFMKDGSSAVISASQQTFRFYAMSKMASNPEVLIRLMNMYIDISESAETDYSLQETYMYSKDGSVHYYNFAPCITALLYKDEKESMYSRMLEAVTTGDASGLKTSTEIQVMDYLTRYNDSGDLDLWQWDRMYGKDGANYLYLDTPYEKKPDLYAAADTEKMLEYGTETNALLYNGIIDIIIGNAEPGSFDNLVASWYTSGGTEITAEVNEWYDAVMGR